MVKIKEYREKRGMTQSDVAKKLKVTQATISQYETGTRNPDVVTLKKLSKILQCTTDDLLESVNIV